MMIWLYNNCVYISYLDVLFRTMSFVNQFVLLYIRTHIHTPISDPITVGTSIYMYFLSPPSTPRQVSTFEHQHIYIHAP